IQSWSGVPRKPGAQGAWMNWSAKKWFWLLLAGAVATVIVLVKLSGRQPVPRVAVVQVVRENLNATISSNGKVEPITPYSIRAQFPTFVEKVLAVEGQAVTRGQLLLTLVADDVHAELDRAREQLVAAQDALRAARTGGRADEAAQLESDLRKAEIERDRLRRERAALERLVAQQAATKEELRQNQAALDRAEADWQRLQSAREEFVRRTRLEVERAALLVEQSRSQIRSLEDKVGDLMAELADLHRVRVRAFIDEPELGGIEPDQTVEITWDALPSKTWEGRTEQIPKQVVSRGTRSVGEVLCSVANDKLELLPNININVRIHLRERRNALVVPRGAVRIEGTRRYVFLVGNGGLGTRLHKREIKVGIASATKYEVLEGLSGGETVALPGDIELRDDMAVRLAG